MPDVIDRVERGQSNVVRRSLDEPSAVSSTLALVPANPAPNNPFPRNRRPRPARRLQWWVWPGAVLAIGLLVSAFVYRPTQRAGAADHVKPADQDLVARGKYLVTVAGCNDCHTPLKSTPRGPVPDADRLLSGHPETVKLPTAPLPAADNPWPTAVSATNTAFAGPWGITYATNLTPDKNTGIGLWTAEMFTQALRTGKHWGQPGARSIQPPMPWGNYAQMSSEDLRAMYAYLRSLPPIRNQVPDYEAPGEKR